MSASSIKHENRKICFFFKFQQDKKYKKTITWNEWKHKTLPIPKIPKKKLPKIETNTKDLKMPINTGKHLNTKKKKKKLKSIAFNIPKLTNIFFKHKSTLININGTETT